MKLRLFLLVISCQCLIGCTNVDAKKDQQSTSDNSLVYKVNPKLKFSRANVVTVGLLQNSVLFKTKTGQYGLVDHKAVNDKFLIEHFNEQQRKLEKSLQNRLKSLDKYFYNSRVYNHARRATIKTMIDDSVIQIPIYFFSSNIGLVAFEPDLDYKNSPYKNLIGKLLFISKNNESNLSNIQELMNFN